MPAPTSRALSQWYAQQPEGKYTCSDCGKVDQKAYVQPQHPFYARGATGTALCSACIAARIQQHHAERKAQLAAAPRCERSGCNRRGTGRYGWGNAKVLLCGTCGKRAASSYTRRYSGNLLLPGPAIDRAEILELASP